MIDHVSVAALTDYAALPAAAVLLAVAALHDVATRTIPDATWIGLLAIGSALRLFEGDLFVGGAVFASVLVVGGLCWRCGFLGGGDVKLLAACAWLVSPVQVPKLVLLTALCGGVLACLYLTLSFVARATRRSSCPTHRASLAARIRRAEWWRIRRRASLPYGCAIAAATLLTLSGR